MKRKEKSYHFQQIIQNAKRIPRLHVQYTFTTLNENYRLAVVRLRPRVTLQFTTIILFH